MSISLRLLFQLQQQVNAQRQAEGLSLASSYPLQPLFAQVWAALRC